MMKNRDNLIGRKQEVGLAEAFGSEIQFSNWLAHSENVSELGRSVGLQMEVREREARVGPFRLDILYKDAATGRNIVVENQRTPTNHDHLGKLLTYAAGFDATFAVWIAPEFCKEHCETLKWLNEKFGKTDGAVGFFGVEVKLWRIDDSKPVVDFTVVARPHAAGAVEPTGVRQKRWKYWKGLITHLKSTESALQLADGDPSGDTYVELPSSNGFNRGFSVSSSRDRWICAYVGSRKREQIGLLRKVRLHHQKQFEREVGGGGMKIDWEDERKWNSFWISAWREADPEDAQDWANQHRWLARAAEKLEAVLPKYAALESTER